MQYGKNVEAEAPKCQKEVNIKSVCHRITLDYSLAFNSKVQLGVYARQGHFVSGDYVQ